MDILPSHAPVNTQDVYTDLHSLNSIKNESTDVALKKVAQEFESIFINMMMKGMRSANAVFEKDSLFQSNESKMYRDMYDQQLSLTMSKGRGVGIADALYNQLKGQYGSDDSTQPENGEFSINKAYDLKPGTVPQNYLMPNRSSSVETVKPFNAEQGGSIPADSVVPPDPSVFSSGEEFVNHILPAAKNISTALGLDPLVMVAQAALETGWGKHIVKNNSGSSYNLFNIKADTSWQGESVSKSTLEYKQGIAVKENAQFRRYESFGESLQDFTSFITENPRYQNALKSVGDAKEFIGELHKAGYATDPKYTDKVISVLKRVQAMVANMSGG